MSASLVDNDTLGRFETAEGEGVVFADYHVVNSRLFIDHVETPVELRGGGAASRLMTLIADHAQTAGLTIVPLCGYAAAWMRRHHRPDIA